MWQFVRCQINIWLNLTRVALFPIRPCLPSPHHIASNHSQIARHFSNWLFILILINIIIKIFHLLFASSHSAWFNMSSSSCFFFQLVSFRSLFICLWIGIIWRWSQELMMLTKLVRFYEQVFLLFSTHIHIKAECICCSLFTHCHIPSNASN